MGSVGGATHFRSGVVKDHLSERESMLRLEGVHFAEEEGIF